MRRISKAGEPAALQAYRRTVGEPAPTFDDMPAEVKEALRDALLREQGWLCCYCMRRVGEGDCRIEHRASQADHTGQQLDYRNLFAACSGDLGGERHCDVSKGSRAISVDPLTVVAEWFRYGDKGTVTSTRPEVAADIVVLNLNAGPLCWERRAALQRFLSGVAGSTRAGQTWTKKRLVAAAARVGEPGGDGRREAFCEVIASWLRRRIERAG